MDADLLIFVVLVLKAPYLESRRGPW